MTALDRITGAAFGLLVFPAMIAVIAATMWLGSKAFERSTGWVREHWPAIVLVAIGSLLMAWFGWSAGPPWMRTP